MGVVVLEVFFSIELGPPLLAYKVSDLRQVVRIRWHIRAADGPGVSPSTQSTLSKLLFKTMEMSIRTKLGIWSEAYSI